MRKSAESRLRNPGISVLRNKVIASSSSTYCSFLPGIKIKRCNCEGRGMMEICSLSSTPEVSWNTSASPRLGRNGNGCAGSMAMGVSTGKIFSRKYSSSHARFLGGSFSGFITVMPDSSSRCRNSSQQVCWRITIGVAISWMASISSSGVMPSKLFLVMPFST